MTSHHTFIPPTNLKFFFTPTIHKTREIAKAHIKNYNLPILQEWFNGDSYMPLRCLITNKPAFSYTLQDLVSGLPKQRFDCDFNHIRQYQNGKRQSGVSVDKAKYPPSAIFRGVYLSKHPNYLVEMMTTITVSTEIHSYISQDSAKGHITLQSFSKDWWPWGLKSKNNFDTFCEKYYLDINYSTFINYLSDIGKPNINESYSAGLLSKQINE